MAKLETLVDQFNGTSLNTTLWSQFTAGSATMSYASTGASVTFPASSTSSTDGDLTSVSSYDMTASYAYMGIVSVLSGTHNDCNLTIRQNGNNYYQFQVEAGTIYAQYVVGGSQTNAWSTTFSLTTHKYWRIRESGGTSFWETSTDGSTWTTRFSTANKITLTAVKVNIGGISWGADTSAGTFKFNNFNTLGTTTQTLTGTGYANSNSFGSGSIGGLVTVTGTGYANANAFGSGVVANVTTVSGTGYANTNSFGGGAITVGVVTISGTGYANTNSFGTGTISPGVVVLTGTGYSNLQSFGAGTLTRNITLTGTALASVNAFGTGSITIGTITITGTGYANTNAFGAGTVSVVNAAIVGTGFQNTTVFGSGYIVLTLAYGEEIFITDVEDIISISGLIDIVIIKDVNDSIAIKSFEDSITIKGDSESLSIQDSTDNIIIHDLEDTLILK